jgi:hypothetical protein
MALGRLFAWLRKPPSVNTEEERIAKLMCGLISNDPDERVYAQRTLFMIVHNRHQDYSEAYILRVLEVLSQQENLLDFGWILRQVEVLSDRLTPYDASENIPAAAQICKHRLRDRYEPGYAAKTLLHPACNPMSKDELLRPASGAPETQPETLLRAVEADKPDQ